MAENFTDWLRQRSEPVWTEVVTHPFTRALFDGVVPTDLMRSYLVQDYQFIDDFLALLGAALVPHGITIASPRLQPASLDHTIWFHRPFRADEWWLYHQFSPFAGGARGLALARVFSQSGELVATVAQEGLIRLRDDRP